MKKIFRFGALALLAAVLFPMLSAAQDRETQNTKWMEYRKGNMPLIIVIADAGSLGEKNDFVVRTKENTGAKSVNTSMQSYTGTMGRFIDDAVFAQTGKHPYLLLSKVHRKYVLMGSVQRYAFPKDAPEEQKETYTAFHAKLREICDNVESEFGYGLLIDFHGLNVKDAVSELGYNLKIADLELANAELNNTPSYLEKSSLKYAAAHLPKKTTFADVIRGKNSLGAIMTKNGFPCTPSPKNLLPERGANYMYTSYIIQNYTSIKAGNKIDGVAMYMNYDARDINTKENDQREINSKAIAKSILEFMQLYSYTNNKAKK